jgi:hypothetical protein
LGRDTTPAIVNSDQSTAAAAASARPALMSSVHASPTPAFTRDASRDAIAAPPAIPTMKIATTVLKAYVVGPRIWTSRRVHTTCSVSEANPLAPSAIAASHACLGSWLLGLGCWVFRLPVTGSGAGTSRAIIHAPAAAMTFNAMPT